MKIGVDVDGVLADFNRSFIQRVIDVTGRDLFPPRPFDIPVWDYPLHYGYSDVEQAHVWQDIKADPLFWEKLAAYEDTRRALHYLLDRAYNCDDVYFITARPGVEAKLQTENWLIDRGYDPPTVLITPHKGLAARTLALDVYIDDRWENCLETAPVCRTLLMDHPWNRAYDTEAHGITRVSSVVGMADAPA